MKFVFHIGLEDVVNIVFFVILAVIIVVTAIELGFITIKRKLKERKEKRAKEKKETHHGQ